MTVDEMGNHPLFMQSLPDDPAGEGTDHDTLAALQALVYDGDPTGPSALSSHAWP